MAKQVRFIDVQSRGSKLKRFIDQSMLPAVISAASSVERGAAIGAEVMRERPFAAYLAAVGFGYLLGYLLAPAPSAASDRHPAFLGDVRARGLGSKPCIPKVGM